MVVCTLINKVYGLIVTGKQYPEDDDYPGLVAISITEEQADKTPYYDIYKPESIVLGH